MRRLYASLLFLTATFAFGQTQNPTASPAGHTSVVPTISLTSMDCPVGFYANRQAGGQVLTASDGKPSGPAQGLHLTLDHLSGPAIKSIEVTVYATSSKPRALLLDMRSSDEVSKTFTLERQADSNSLTEADVWMQQVGSVRWADLIAVTFADGTTWRASGNLKCHAVPSNFLPVGNR